MLFNQAIEEFCAWKKINVKEGTIKGYDLILRQFCIFVRNCDIELIRLGDVTTWFELMKTLNWQHNSFIPRAMALRKFFEFWRKRGEEVLDPWLIPVPPKKYTIPRVLTEENYQKLLAIIPEKTNDSRHIRNRAIITLLWDTGARHSEILALDLDDLNPHRQRAVIKTEKSQGIRPFREIFWTQYTDEVLRRWLQKRKQLEEKMRIQDTNAIFISICAGQSNTRGRRFGIKGSCEMLRRYCIRANMPYINAHSFRHHMGHDIIKKGGSSSDVMNILGHASLASSSVYTMMQDVELEERYRKFKGN